MTTEIEKIAIVGSGVVGTSWATIFASAGFRVEMFDISKKQLEDARRNVEMNLKRLNEIGLCRGTISAEVALSNVTTSDDLKRVLSGAGYVQESALEDVEFRRKLWRQLDELADDDAILASSTSTIPASKFTEHLKRRERCIIAHPVNPPLFLPLTEVVPAPWTSAATIDRTMQLMRKIGQKPVELKKEVVGFAVNRVQFALLSEVWRLVADGVIGVDDVDTVMSEGLGPRYAFNGPLETIHLNASGIVDYFERYTNGIKAVIESQIRLPPPNFDEKSMIDKMANVLNRKMSVEKIGEFQKQRELNLIELAKMKKKLDETTN